MACAIIHDGSGRAIGMMCGLPKRVMCIFCCNQLADKLCDFATGKNKTCDARMCSKCATSVGDNLDYCPTHKHELPPPQGQLFGEQQ